ncbi:MAG: hypothetical protein ACT4TC_05680 [Myxococcaceae bacterium]
MHLFAEHNVAKSFLAMPALEDVGELATRLSDVHDGTYSWSSRGGHLGDKGSDFLRDADVAS